MTTINSAVAAYAALDWLERQKVQTRQNANSPLSHLSPLEGRGWPVGPGEGSKTASADHVVDG